VLAPWRGPPLQLVHVIIKLNAVIVKVGPRHGPPKGEPRRVRSLRLIRRDGDSRGTFGAAEQAGGRQTLCVMRLNVDR
jgi:hypothetical protein